MEGSSSDGGAWSHEWSEDGEGDFADFSLEDMAVNMEVVDGTDFDMGGIMDDLQAGVMNAQMAGEASHQITINDAAVPVDLGVAADTMAALTGEMGDVMGDSGIVFNVPDVSVEEMPAIGMPAMPEIAPAMPGIFDDDASTPDDPVLGMMAGLGMPGLDPNDPMALNAVPMSALMNPA